MKVSDLKAYLEWKKDMSKPHPWFDKKKGKGNA